jgi:hypothetical protein
MVLAQTISLPLCTMTSQIMSKTPSQVNYLTTQMVKMSTLVSELTIVVRMLPLKNSWLSLQEMKPPPEAEF